MSKNPRNQWKSMKIANTDRGYLHILWTTWVIPRKFLGSMWLIILSHKKPGFFPLFRRYNFRKTTGPQPLYGYEPCQTSNMEPFAKILYG